MNKETQHFKTSTVKYFDSITLKIPQNLNKFDITKITTNDS